MSPAVAGGFLSTVAPEKSPYLASCSFWRWLAFLGTPWLWPHPFSLYQQTMAPHSSTLAWKIPWTEEPGGLQSMGSWRVGHDWATSLSLSCIGEGNGNPLQYSCLENPRDGGVWWAAIHGVAQSWTRLKRLSSSSIFTSLSPLCVCVFSSSVCYTSYKDTCYWISGHLGSSRMISLSQDPNLIRSLKNPPFFFK